MLTLANVKCIGPLYRKKRKLTGVPSLLNCYWSTKQKKGEGLTKGQVGTHDMEIRGNSLNFEAAVKLKRQKTADFCRPEANIFCPK